MIEIYWPWELPKKIKGTAVVVDVWAATTNIATFLYKTQKQVFILNKEQAVGVKRKDKKAEIIGESRELPEDFFFVSNHPWEIAQVDLPDKIYYMSTNGARTIELLMQKEAKEVVAASLVNFSAVSERLKTKEKIILVPAGEITFFEPKCPEDFGCVSLIKRKLEGERIDLGKSIGRIKKDFRRYYFVEHEENKTLGEKDMEIIFQVDSYPVVPICRKKSGLIEIRKG